MRVHRRRGLVLASTAAVVAMIATVPSSASPGGRVDRASTRDAGNEKGGERGDELLARAMYEASRLSAPGTTVRPGAWGAAEAAAARLSVRGGNWQEITDLPTNNDDPNYADPFWSNVGAGWFQIAGRISALASTHGTMWAGAADGGVWRSTDRGGHWTPWSNGLPRLAVGSLAVNPRDGSLWVGLGEANTAFENFKDHGVFRLPAGARTWQRVGTPPNLARTLTYRLRFDGAGHVYDATNRGLFRHDASSSRGSWQLVLKPDPNPTSSPYRSSHISDVVAVPGSNGRTMLAVLGWRGGTLPADVRYNGFYVSTSGGRAGTWHRVAPRGDIDPNDIGRTTLDVTGGRIYAVIESPGRLSAPDTRQGFSNLLGVFVSRSGNPAGPWTRLAGPRELCRSGSALAPFGVCPGIQAWYNQYILADPRNPDHVYVALEEVFESTNGGRTWDVAGPYWNFTRPCFERGSCRPTTHPDQHALVTAGGDIWVGNDGGVWHRPLTNHSRDSWVNTNRTLHNLQYYYAGIGRVRGGDAIWGGTQDNGSILKRPGLDHMVIPQGGDGGDVIVDPNNGNRAVTEYVFLNMTLTTNGGRSDGSFRTFRTIGPTCRNFEYQLKRCDPNPRFIAPFEADETNPNHHWVAGGQYVWESRAGWDTVCNNDRCDWKIVHDTGAGHQVSAIDLTGRTIYAGWCGPCNPKQGAPFRSGIDTNYGGSWHRISAPNLPNRILNSINVDPADPAHVFAIYGAFSRRWIPDNSAGQGHVFESRNGGRTWTDISGNLPDVPADDLVMWRGKLVVATDIGVFVADRDRPNRWSRLGHGLPRSAVWDLTLSPDRSYLVAVTHGRGLWKISSV